jgi:hypothetical protein
MNDDTLITAVREPFTGVHMNIPVEQIVSRGRAVRARRRIPGMAGALAVAAGAALAVTALLPAGHQPGIRLAAWTVARQADGTVHVTIRQLRDPVGLQRQLRADGVPASVTFFGQQNPSCRDYPAASPGLTRRVISPYQGNSRRDTVLVIHPSALPDDAGVQIGASRVQHPGQGGVAIAILTGLVQASPQCTGG